MRETLDQYHGMVLTCHFATVQSSGPENWHVCCSREGDLELRRPYCLLICCFFGTLGGDVPHTNVFIWVCLVRQTIPAVCINRNCNTVALVTFYDDEFAQLREAIESRLGDTPTTTVRSAQIVVYMVRKTYDHPRLKTFFIMFFSPRDYSLSCWFCYCPRSTSVRGPLNWSTANSSSVTIPSPIHWNFFTNSPILGIHLKIRLNSRNCLR